MWTTAIFCIFFTLYSNSVGSPSGLLNQRKVPDSVAEDASLTFVPLAEKYGYTAETHEVQTDDGYLLTLHRITGSPNYNSDLPKIGTVLVQHGLLCSSIDWIIMGPGKGLGYLLADRGYDVWFGNSRGNTWSTKHAYLNTKSDEYWSFSWHEMGVYDLPAFIDYILHITKELNIYYIGHSQGTSELFVYGSEKPENAHKIKIGFALAPVAYMKNLESPFVQIAAKIQKLINAGAHILGINQFMPKTEFLTEIGKLFCIDEHPLTQSLCSDVLFLLCGFDSEQLNATMLPAIVGHTPAGASITQLLHYAQEIVSGKFRMIDKGVIGNLKKYGTIHPPAYNVSRINFPVSLHYSQNDWMASEEDVLKLADEIPNVIKHPVPFKKFNHLDFMWAIDAKALVYDTIFEMMSEVSKK